VLFTLWDSFVLNDAETALVKSCHPPNPTTNHLPPPHPLRISSGWFDAALSEKGIAEAAAGGKALKDQGFTFDAAHSSVLQRANTTCEALLAGVGKSVLCLAFFRQHFSLSLSLSLALSLSLSLSFFRSPTHTLTHARTHTRTATRPPKHGHLCCPPVHPNRPK
jgi:hypothetical protein